MRISCVGLQTETAIIIQVRSLDDSATIRLMVVRSLARVGTTLNKTIYLFLES
jgi:hypothetical protein